ncbi:SH3 domain-containing protein [Azotobacter vinelandii]
MRIPILMMFIAATTLAMDADARGRRGGGGKSYSSFSSSYKPKGKPCGNSYIAANKTCRIGSSTARAAAGVAAAGAAGTAGLALADDGDYYVSAQTLNVRSESSASGHVVRKLKQGDKVHAYEVGSDWVRISPADSNPEWVTGKYLSASRP